MTEGPLVLAYGLGVDSTAVLCGWRERGVRPDAILFADVGDEKDETYAYLGVVGPWLEAAGFPPVVTVRNVVGDYKNWPPYRTLGENCLTNGTLPSLAFGFKSCSIKWKQVPQNKWTDRWQPAVDCWAKGGRVRKAIGFDASPKDRKRYAKGPTDDPKYEYLYPLIEWGWDRDRCEAEIVKAGLPVPPKSSCVFCPSVKPAEVRAYKAEYLRKIVVMEARAAPRLEKIEGLWRNGCKGTRGAEKKPGRITDFIRDEGLLPADEIERLQRQVPLEIVANQHRHVAGEEIPSWEEFFEMLQNPDQFMCEA